MTTSKPYRNPINIAGGEERFVCPQSLVLNTYLGCSHECIYCYAKYLLEMYGHWNKRIPADTSIIRKTIGDALSGKSKGVIPDLIRMKVPFRCSNLTDPFQEAEREHRASLETLKILKEFQYPVIINTKGVIYADDEYIELLKAIPCVLQETITTIDDDMASKLEPHAPRPSERIKALKKAADNGIITQIRYSPVFPLLTDQPLELFTKCKEIGVKDVVCEFFRLPLNKKYLDLINTSLGMNYLEYLKSKNYPMIKTRHWWKVQKPFIFDEYARFKKIAEDIGLNFYVCCEEKPEINGWVNCCGTCKYKGFEKCMDWTIQMNGKKFSEIPTPFDRYIDDTTCPYKEEYRKFFEEGKHDGNLYHLNFDPITKTYSVGEKKENGKQGRLFE